MSDYGVTDKGFQMRRLDEIYADICKRFKDEVGVDPSENPQSVMNVLFTIFADLGGLCCCISAAFSQYCLRRCVR